VGHERARGHDPLVQAQERGPVLVHGEAGHHPHHLPQEVHDGPDVVELHPQPLRAQIDDLESGGLGSGPLTVGVAGVAVGLRLGAEEVLDELVGAAGAHVLGEVGAAGPEDAGDLRPVRRHRVPAHDEVERRVAERQRGVLRRGDDHRSARVEQGGGLGDIRGPALGGDGETRQLPCRRQHFAATGLDVESGLRHGQTLAHGPRVSPGGTRLGGPPLEPREVPAVGGGGFGLADELLEGFRAYGGFRGFRGFGSTGGRVHRVMVTGRVRVPRPNSPRGRGRGRGHRALLRSSP
jgi:hypothetical protein